MNDDYVDDIFSGFVCLQKQDFRQGKHRDGVWILYYL